MTGRSKPTWSDVKGKLTDFDRQGLIGLVQDLYEASKDNQAFLHARFALGGDVLKPYKAPIDRWLWPDVFKNQDTSVAKAKKAISDYKNAIGKPEGLPELMVFYCERAADFSNDIGLQDEGYCDALVRMFGQALKTIDALSEDCRPALMTRLDSVRHISHNFGYGVGKGVVGTIGGGKAKPTGKIDIAVMQSLSLRTGNRRRVPPRRWGVL